jgi:Mg2+-importing ATPase
MIVFGLVSSLFDLLTFGALLLLFRADEATFQTAWFVVSVLTELAVVLVLRTRRSALRSRPSRLLLFTTLLVGALAMALPYLGPIAAIFDFVALPLPILGAMMLIVLCYVAASESAKAQFYRHLQARSAANRAGP